MESLAKAVAVIFLVVTAAVFIGLVVFLKKYIPFSSKWIVVGPAALVASFAIALIVLKIITLLQ